jgi:GTPase involved in cell partitioning and DNA repair
MYVKQLGTLRSQELPESVPILYTVNNDGSINFSQELRKLNRSLVDQFMLILNNSTSVAANDAFQDECNIITEKMRFVLMNITQLLNKLRAHQARQTVIVALQEQTKRKNEEAAQLEKYVAYNCELTVLDYQTFILEISIEMEYD